MAHLNHHLRAFTLIETVIAFVIVMICFGVAGTTFLSVQHTAQDWNSLKTELAFEEILHTTKKSKRYLDERVEYSTFYVEKSVRQLDQTSGLLKIELKAYTKQGQFLRNSYELLQIDRP